MKVIFDAVNKLEFGGKAYWLSWLVRNGYEVPFAFFLPAKRSVWSVAQLRTQENELKARLSPFLVDDLTYDVAIRSSATCEDSDEGSLAGYFTSVISRMTFEDVLHNIQRVSESLKESPVGPNCRMGVVIQKRIESSYAGVAFSSDPLSGARNRSVISLIAGAGKPLVSGLVKGEDVVVSDEGLGPVVSQHSTPLSDAELLKIRDTVKAIELQLDQPINIEWCIEKDSDRLCILQCRPVSGHTVKGDSLIPVTTSSHARIPQALRDVGKVSMRLRANGYGVDVSKAYLVFAKRGQSEISLPDLRSITPSPECSAYSIVVISPQRVQGKVLRAFAGREKLDATIREIASRALLGYWSSAILVQEVFDAEYTGMVKKLDDGYLVEVARGHFTPKGVVATCRYLVDNGGVVNTLDKTSQTARFQIFGDSILKTEIKSDDSVTSIPEREIRCIVEKFSPLLDKERVSVEFGSVRRSLGDSLKHYLIDVIKESNGETVDAWMLEEGVISRGAMTGALISINFEDSLTDLDMHFFDEVPGEHTQDEQIFLCQRPNINLLRLITTQTPKRIGFVFKEASVLCHLAILLREKGIPAIQTDRFEELKAGTMATLDASSVGLRPSQRVVILADSHSPARIPRKKRDVFAKAMTGGRV